MKKTKKKQYNHQFNTKKNYIIYISSSVESESITYTRFIGESDAVVTVVSTLFLFFDTVTSRRSINSRNFGLCMKTLLS